MAFTARRVVDIAASIGYGAFITRTRDVAICLATRLEGRARRGLVWALRLVGCSGPSLSDLQCLDKDGASQVAPTEAPRSVSLVQVLTLTSPLHLH